MEKINSKYNTEFTNKLLENKHIFDELYQACNNTFEKYCGSYLFDGMKYEYCGRMYEKQQLLYDSVKNVNTVLEIGTYMGHSLLIMLLSNPNLKITCIDLYAKYTKPAVAVLNKYFNNNITFLNGNSLDVLPKLKQKFDFFHVDGKHKNLFITKEFNYIINLSTSSTLKIIFDDEFCMIPLQKHIKNYFKIIKEIKTHCEWGNLYLEIIL